MSKKKVSENMTNTEIAYIAACCYNANKFYCEALGDFSQPSWDDAPHEIKRSAVNGVLFVLDNQNMTSADQHENWMKVKLADGWVYGKEKDMEKKTHPCLVPYDQLPKDQQFKDYLFRLSVVNAIVALGRKSKES